MAGKLARLPSILVPLLLLGSLLLPLWYTHMEAVQYQGDEVLKVLVYASHVEGNLHEIRLLNHYVGVVLPEHFWELDVLPYVLGALLALAVLGAAAPARFRRRLGVAILVAFLGCAAGGGVVLYERLHQLGHERTKSPFARIDDFMPPVLGTKKIANFTIHTGLGVGGWCFCAAFLAAGAGVLMSRRQRERGG